MNKRKRELVVRTQLILISLFAGLIAGAIVSAVVVRHEFAQQQRELEARNNELQELNTLVESMMDAEEVSASMLQIEKEHTEEEVAEQVRHIEEEIREQTWYLRLINEAFPLESSFQPEELTEIAPGHRVDSRVAEAALQMLSDAQAEGLNLVVISAYRSYEQQKEIFAETMQEWNEQGLNWFDAYRETKMSVAAPGSSEHQAGLALDIIAEAYDFLDEQQSETPEMQWLVANSWRYGFILRYPADKIHITGIIYEPWHYRYVGVDAAREITERGITLEEFLGVI